MVNMLSSDYTDDYTWQLAFFLWVFYDIKNCQNVAWSSLWLCNAMIIFPEPFDSGDFKSQKIAFTKLQLETDNGHQLYKSVHKNGKKKK